MARSVAEDEGTEIEKEIRCVVELTNGVLTNRWERSGTNTNAKQKTINQSNYKNYIKVVIELHW